MKKNTAHHATAQVTLSKKVDSRGARSFRVAFFLIFAAFFVSSCGKEDQETKKQKKEIKLAVTEDSKLQESTENLLKKRGSLVRMKRKLKKKRTELETKKRQLAAGDTKAAEKLKKEEAELKKKETSLFQQEGALNKKLSNILQHRSALLTKATQALSAASASSKVPKIAVREHSMSRREKSLAQREKDLSLRETRLAKREADIAKREKDLLKGCAGISAPVYTVTTIQAPRNSGSRTYSKSDVKSVFGKALHTMSSRGIKSSDLPAGLSKLKSDIRGYIKKKEYYRGKLAADQFLKIVRRIRIDRGFVGAKMARLHKRIARKKLSSSQEKKANELFRQTTSAYSDGRFKRANSKLNQIYSVTR